MRYFKRHIRFCQFAKTKSLIYLEEIFYHASETLTSKMEESLHYIHAKFCYWRAYETNFTWGGPSSPSPPCSSSCETTKFSTKLALDFPQISCVLRNWLKFHINPEHVLKKLLNDFLNLSFYWVTITSTFLFLKYKFTVLDVAILAEINLKM